MEAFRAADLEPYAIDFRGFGGTARDITGKFVNYGTFYFPSYFPVWFNLSA